MTNDFCPVDCFSYKIEHDWTIEKKLDEKMLDEKEQETSYEYHDH